ncbi:MAG: hypothetical protein ACI8WB_004420 [Phenylobacterium sp.]|jgi:hypothetical protein
MKYLVLQKVLQKVISTMMRTPMATIPARRIPALLSCCLIATSLFSQLASAESLKVGLVEYPPHINFKHDETNDKAYQYVDKVLKGLYQHVEFIRFPNKRALVELKKGNIDLLFPLDGTQKDIKQLSRPLFRSVPGLCFRKENFIPFLSATHLFDGLNIGTPAGTDVISALKNSKARLKVIEGSDALNRGIKLLMVSRIDAFYHPSPVKVYHYSNKLSKDVACSYFYGYSAGVYIAVDPNMSNDKYRLIDNAFSNELKIKSYEYYFAERD